MNLFFWRDNRGVEVDYVIEKVGRLIPIEVKLTSSPKLNDVRHLKTFLQEYPNAHQGFLICHCEMPMLLADNITALPWQKMLESVV